ncbi:hypothetical protein [Acidovorax sp. LjRoot117]|uniref:hypothetical protein n=1 Tax=Acidovorax sp. LjRoot117 TaxID=3342255 RepID=UPI003ECCE70D
MAKGLTLDCAALWGFIRKDGGWWSVLRLTGHWSPTYSLAEVEEILVTLHKGGFLECQALHRAGTVYAVTSKCSVLPGITAAASAPSSTTGPVAASTRPQSMRGAFVPPPMPTARQGALDHTNCPSLMQGKRNAYRSTTA